MDERIIPTRENILVCTESFVPEVWDEGQMPVDRQKDDYSVYDKEWAGKFIGEIIAAAKDDRMNVKKAISADIAATAQAQNQIDRYMAVCERELRRKDLSEERRKALLDCMEMTVSSLEQASAESRQFQREQLNHLHKLPWKLLGAGTLIFFGVLGGAAWLKVA